jgi:putative peptidoglycan lipid II flippase
LVQSGIAERRENALVLASTLMLFAFAVLSLVAGAGVLLAGPLLTLSAPGLAPETAELARRMAVFTWPALIGLGLAMLAARVHQAGSRFVLAAFIPLLGAGVQLVALLSLSGRLGGMAIALATAVSSALEAAFLVLALGVGRVLVRRVDFRQPELRTALRLMLPLLIANLVVRSTPVVDRYLGSQLGAGAISHLGYAFRPVTMLGVLLSTGLVTVLFPRMALHAAGEDRVALRRTLSRGLQQVWLVVAPVVMIAIVLALPLVRLAYRRGAFSEDDAVAVATILQIYLLALPPTCLGGLVSQAFYVLNDTRTPAIGSSIEAVLYVGYTAFLTQQLGAPGVAIGYVLYFNFSFVWQAALVRRRTGGAELATMLRAFGLPALAALLAAAAASAFCRTFPDIEALTTIGVAGSLGLVLYVCLVLTFGVPEAVALWRRFGRSARM